MRNGLAKNRTAGARRNWDAHSSPRLSRPPAKPAHRIAYVGDRLDNDALPARAAGMIAVFLRRGPRGWMPAEQPEIARAHLRLDSLATLPEALDSL
jgi:FMN phosphatase YigB (HAD superfamily)